jgi:GNAT superfamily N-acetyltransferase
MSGSPRPSPAVVPFRPAHVTRAAALVTASVARLREQVPALPEAWSDERVVRRVVRALAERGTGVAIVGRNRSLVGFQAATLLDGHGGRWAYTPDVGHATVAASGGSGAADGNRVVERLYAALAGGWVRDAYVEHVVTVLADDPARIAAFGRLGFAPHVVDLVRDLAPVDGGAVPAGGEVRRALPADAAAVHELHAALVRHLRGSPVFRSVPPAPALELQRRVIADPASAVFLAQVRGEPVAFLRIGPCADDVATIVRDRRTASITAAFTVPRARGAGIGTALLAEAVEWAREAGHVRCAVDHEAANGEAARFWSRHATPVAISVARRLPATAVPGVG